MESEGLIKNVVKSDPWQRYGLTGQIFSVAGVISYLGIGFTGLELGHTSAHAPLIVILIGGAYLFVSYKLKQKKDIAAQEERRREARPKSEPTEGDQAFLEQFRAADGKISAKDLEKFRTPHDSKKTKDELLASLAHQRMEGWIGRGKCLKYGNTYYTREAFENSDMTVIQ